MGDPYELTEEEEQLSSAVDAAVYEFANKIVPLLPEIIRLNERMFEAEIMDGTTAALVPDAKAPDGWRVGTGAEQLERFRENQLREISDVIRALGIEPEKHGATWERFDENFPLGADVEGGALGPHCVNCFSLNCYGCG